MHACTGCRWVEWMRIWEMQHLHHELLTSDARVGARVSVEHACGSPVVSPYKTAPPQREVAAQPTPNAQPRWQEKTICPYHSMLPAQQPALPHRLLVPASARAWPLS